MKTLHACLLSASLVLTLLPIHALAQQVCSPFDALPGAPGTDGGTLADVAACCDGAATDEGCGPCLCSDCGDEPPERNIGRPVDTLSGFAWLNRTDIAIDSPRGPGIRFARTYSTHWAQSRGGRDEIGRLGPGWTDTYGTRLVLDGNTPPQTVTYRKADTGTENFTRRPDGTYAARLPGRRFFYDATTQRWVLEKFDASYEVFDTNGRLVHLRAQDGGEAHLVYTGEDPSCPVQTARPSGTLCRVEFLFGHKLWLRYASTTYPGAARLASIAWDAAGTQLLAQFAYDAGGHLQTVTQADGRQETYTYGFTHSFPRHPGQTVKLLTAATDGDNAQVEAFTYQQRTLAPSRVIAHETPEGRYTFGYGIYDTVPERSTTIHSSREELRLTWEGGKLKTVCQLDATGNCDLARMKEVTLPTSGILAPSCVRDFNGYHTRYLRDALGRQTSILPGLVDCQNPTAAEARHEVLTGYVADSNRRAWSSRASVDTSAPAGMTTFTVDDYTSPASAIDPLCGNSSCQTPTAYNTPPSALTSQVQQRVRVGRTLSGTHWDWETRVEVTKYTYDSAGLLVNVDGPRTDVDDSTTYEYYDALGPLHTAGRLKKILRGTRVLAEYSDYNSRGQPQRVVDGNGQETLSTYDAEGRRLTIQGPDETQPTQFIYSDGGRLKEVRFPRGHRLLYGHDSSGRLNSVGLTYTTTGTPTSFDEEVQYEWGTTSANSGQLLRESYLREGTVVRTTTYGYDSQGRRAVVRHLRVEDFTQTHAALRLTRFNERGDIIATQVGTSTNSLGDDLEPEVSYLYDHLQRLIETPLTGHQLRYDWHDNLTEVYETADPPGGSTLPKVMYRYDDFGRLAEVQSDIYGVILYAYDLAGNRVKELRTGDLKTYAYDGSGRVTAIPASAPTQTFTYDTDAAATVIDCATGTALGTSNGVGRLTAVTDASGTTYFGYTAGGRRRFEARMAPSASCAKVMRWEFDGHGMLAAIRYPSGATIRLGYPAAGQLHPHRPSTVSLEVGATTVPLATELTWEDYTLTRYTAGNGFSWHLSRWLDGTPKEWKVTRGPEEDVVRLRAFSEEVNGLVEPRLDGRDSPLRIEEDDASRTRNFSYQEHTGYLTSDVRSGSHETFGHTWWGDRTERTTVDELTGLPITYELLFHNSSLLFERMEVDTATNTPTYRTYLHGGGGAVEEMTETSGSTSKSLALCYDNQSHVAAVVGAGGQYSRQIVDFRGQRVREVWPLNGLVTDYWVGEEGELLAELGAASLTEQYPRPVWEYVYMGGQPIARVELEEAANGTTTYRGLTFLFGGHLSELLMEADAWGHVVRNHDYTAFGAREARHSPTQQLSRTLSRTGFPATQVTLPAPSTARLSIENFSLAECDSVAILDEEGNLLKRLLPGPHASFETEPLPAQGSALRVWLEQGLCPGASSLTLTEVQSSWGRAEQTMLSGHEYTNPSPGFTASLSLPPDTHLLIESHPAACDTLEVRRSGTGDLLWAWPADSSIFRTAWTPALSGNVTVGISSTPGCTGASRSFTLRRMYTRLAPGAPANLHLPGQRALTAAASSRRGAFGDPEPTLLESWYRTYEPATGRYLQPEPLAAVDAAMAIGPTYAYAANGPLHYIDPDGLRINVTGDRGPDRFGDTRGGCGVNGHLAVTCIQETIGPSKPCMPRCVNGEELYYFDIDLSFTVYVNYRNLSVRNENSKVRDHSDNNLYPLTEHEGMHVADLMSHMDEATINRSYQTEGFSSPVQCELARQSLPKSLERYVTAGRSKTTNRDPP